MFDMVNGYFRPGLQRHDHTFRRPLHNKAVPCRGPSGNRVGPAEFLSYGYCCKVRCLTSRYFDVGQKKGESRAARINRS